MNDYWSNDVETAALLARLDPLPDDPVCLDECPEEDPPERWVPRSTWTPLP